MEGSDIASNFREQNARLVPLMLKRLLLFHNDIADIPMDNCSSIMSDAVIRMDVDKEEKEMSESVSDLSHLGGGSAPSSPESKSPKLNGNVHFKMYL